MNGKWLANLDMYRKVPGDLTEQSQQGSMVSWVAVLAMAILFVRETQQFLTPHLVTDLSLDKTNSRLSKIKANFNITMMDLACEFATVNVVSVLGNEQNITKDIQRWPVDALNNKHAVDVKHNDEQHHDVVMHDVGVTESLEKLHENGEDAVSLDEENFLFAMEDHEFVFVDFFAGWCSHCQALAPTWERFAEVMHDVEDAVDPRFIQDYTPEEYERAKRLKFPVLVAKVDCVAHHDFCAKQRIRAYPTLTLFVDGERYKGGDYRGDRTILHMLTFLTLVEEETQATDAVGIKQHADMALQKHFNMSQEHQDYIHAMERTHRHHELIVSNVAAAGHVGCQLAGSLYMNRVPGHFFIQAESKGLNLDPRMVNLSHTIHHMSFEYVDADEHENVIARHSHKRPPRASGLVEPNNFTRLVHPMDGSSYVTHDLHEAHHFHLKLVPTNDYDYQVLHNFHLSLYPSDRVPEVKFVLDLSPIAVHYRMRRRPWYDYVTSVLALIGGSYTLLGMLASFFRVTTQKLTSPRKFNYPRPPPKRAAS